MKIKTHKGLSKRIRKTGSKKGKKSVLVHYPQNDNHHLRGKKTAQQKNRKKGRISLSDKTKINKIKNFIK